MKIGIISDIHEDIKSLKIALNILKEENCEEFICLGDMIGYSVPYQGFLRSRDSNEVLSELKKICKNNFVVGNHDLYAVKKIPKYKAGFKYSKNWYDLDYQSKKEISQDKIYLYDNNELLSLLSKENKEFIKKLPEYLIKNFGGNNVFFSHYAYPDFVGNTTFEIGKIDDLNKHFSFMKKNGCILGISGHDHKEGMTIFTQNELLKIPFNVEYKIKNTLTWITGPCVVNGSFANGVMVYDTDKNSIKALQINSIKHIPPEWRKL